jgi:hypothetical protein
MFQPLRLLLRSVSLLFHARRAFWLEIFRFCLFLIGASKSFSSVQNVEFVTGSAIFVYYCMTSFYNVLLYFLAHEEACE